MLFVGLLMPTFFFHRNVSIELSSTNAVDLARHGFNLCEIFHAIQLYIANALAEFNKSTVELSLFLTKIADKLEIYVDAKQTNIKIVDVNLM